MVDLISALVFVIKLYLAFLRMLPISKFVFPNLTCLNFESRVSRLLTNESANKKFQCKLCWNLRQMGEFVST
jgi:hypothetical protein